MCRISEILHPGLIDCSDPNSSLPPAGSLRMLQDEEYNHQATEVPFNLIYYHCPYYHSKSTRPLQCCVIHELQALRQLHKSS